MYPDQQQTRPEDYPVDYLNQIAPQSTRRSSGGPNFKLIMLLLGGALIIAMGLMLVGTLTSKPNVDQRLAARLSQTSGIVDESHDNIKSSQLRSLNSSLNIILANANRDIGGYLSSTGVDPKKLDASAAGPEQQEAAELKAKLEDARLNATFDRTYARELAYRLETINTYLKTAYDGATNSDYKALLANTSKDIGPIYEQIAKFNEDGS